jgi:hypothetical protein
MSNKTRSSLQSAVASKILALWPALKGSLALVRKPCVRPACQACACGDNHPAYLLSFTHRGRRKSMYVPARLVPVLRRAVHNGRRIEQLLYRVGPLLIQEDRRNTQTSRVGKIGATASKSIAYAKNTRDKN